MVKALGSGSGSGIPLNQDMELKKFISGVSSNSDFDTVKSKFGLLIV